MPIKPVNFNDFRLGLNTKTPAAALDPKELSICVNLKILPLGALETREGLTQYTTSALTNPASFMCYFPIEADLGNTRVYADTDDREWADTSAREWVKEVPAATSADELLITKDDHKLYYLNTSKAPVNITTLEGQGMILPFGQYALLLDGSYLKVWNKSTGTVKIAYDDGTGTTGYQHDNTGLTEDTEIKLYGASNTKVGIKFVTQDWTSGYQITITAVEVYVKRVGAATGNVGCELYTNAGVLAATSDTIFSAADLDTDYELLTFEFSSGSMSPETLYWAVITYSDGDAAKYIQVAYDTVASGGDAKYYDGAWNDDTTKAALMAIKPGRPPKGRFGVIDANRVYVAGDPSNPGLVWYSNANDIFDWSTTDGGGYVGAMDSNAASFPVGALVSQYGDIYVFGQASQPYLCKLTGDSPSDFSLPPMFQKVYSTWRTALPVVNDIWFGSEAGMNALAGVEQYGDLRTFTESDAIQDKIVDYWGDDTAFAGYCGRTGQLFLKLASYPRCLVVHTKLPIQDNRGRIRYPWTEYVFVRANLSSSTHKWTKSGNGTNEYYCQLSAGGDPSIDDPAYVLLEDSFVTEGTIGSLNDHEWVYGNNDTLGYNTVYIRDDSGDPDTTGIVIKTVLEPTCFGEYENKFFIGFDDGYIYYLDPTVVKDNSVEPSYVCAGKLLESPFNETCVDKYNVSIGTDGSSITTDIEIYDEAVDVDDLESTAPDVSDSIAFDTKSDGNINANYNQFMVALRNIDPNNAILRINSIQLLILALSM